MDINSLFKTAGWIRTQGFKSLPSFSRGSALFQPPQPLPHSLKIMYKVSAPDLLAMPANYYGVKATELMPIKALVTARLNAAADKARRVRIANAEKRKASQQICKTPEMIIAREQRILHREILKWTRSKAAAVQHISHLREILKKAQKAGAYLMSAPAELVAELTDGRNWGIHPELAYICEMRGLF